MTAVRGQNLPAARAGECYKQPRHLVWSNWRGVTLPPPPLGRRHRPPSYTVYRTLLYLEALMMRRVEHSFWPAALACDGGHGVPTHSACALCSPDHTFSASSHSSAHTIHVDHPSSTIYHPMSMMSGPAGNPKGLCCQRPNDEQC